MLCTSWSCNPLSGRRYRGDLLGYLQVVVDPTPGGGHTVTFSGTLVPFFDGPSSPYQANFSATISTGVQWTSFE